MKRIMSTTLLLALGLSAQAAKPQRAVEQVDHGSRVSLSVAHGPTSKPNTHRHINEWTTSAPQPVSPLMQRFDERQPFVSRLDSISASAHNKRMAQSTVSVAKTTPECQDINNFASRSGSALADYIVSLPDYECTYVLFSGTTATQARTIYSDSNVTAIANRIQSLASSYDASSMAIGNLVLVLRAGYFTATARTEIGLPLPGASAHSAVKNAISAMLNSPNLFRNNAAHPALANEVFILITNANEVGSYFSRMPGFVKKFTNTSSAPNAADELKSNASASQAFTGVLTNYYRAQWDANAQAARETDTTYSQALVDFVRNNKMSLAGSAYEYQLKDVSNEAWRFMGYSSTQFNYLKPKLQTVLVENTWSAGNRAIWMAGVSAVKWYDNANCAQYNNACNAEQTVADGILVNNYTCSATIKIRAQQMSSSELQQSCALMAAEETYFHKMMQTNNTPVAGDNNTALEVVVFDDYSNYNDYAGFIYDISTDNGGMYLEGDPSVVGNQARFIAHEASWLRPTFSVWNLEHEYIHYLDGRFNLKGDFGASTVRPTVWWLEGLGEYLSYKNNNQAAIDKVKTNKYLLSTIFGNTYSMSDYTDRAYRWGYMAVRFMNERHRADIDAILPKFRSGDYDGYYGYMTNTIGTRYDAEFQSWAQQATTAGNPPEPTVNKPPVANFSSTASGLTVTFSDSSTDSDGSIASRAWNFGDGSSSTVSSPSKTYAAAGTYSVALTVTDNQGASASVTKSVTVTSSGAAALSNNVAVTAAGAQNSEAHYYIDVPSGQASVTIAISGGSGDADLYIKRDATPTTSSYDYRPYLSGNNETVTINNPVAGRYFVMLRGYSAHSGVSLLAKYVSGGGSTLPECSSRTTLSNGCKISNLSVTGVGHSNWIYLWIPTGAKNLQITTSGGTGNADLYLKAGGWPSTTSYDVSSSTSGNNESVTRTTPTGNAWHYINLYGASIYSGVTIQATWQ